MCHPARAWVLLAVAGALGGCGARAGGGAIGVSTAGGGAGSQAIDAGAEAGAPLVNPIPRDFRTSLARVSGPARFLSKGHAGGRWDADVYADPAGAEALRADRGPIAPGARFVEEHFERGDGGAGPTMMMEKRAPGFDAEHGDWRYVVVGARGDVVKDGVDGTSEAPPRGGLHDVASCAGCHGDAPHDHVFRVGDGSVAAPDVSSSPAPPSPPRAGSPPPR